MSLQEAVGSLRNLGVNFFGVPHFLLGSILGSPYLGKLPVLLMSFGIHDGALGCLMGASLNIWASCSAGGFVPTPLNPKTLNPRIFEVARLQGVMTPNLGTPCPDEFSGVCNWWRVAPRQLF